MNADQVIDALGGTRAVAALCELSDSAVSQWRKSGIPKPWIKFLQAIRPEVLAGVAGAAAISHAANVPARD